MSDASIEHHEATPSLSVLLDDNFSENVDRYFHTCAPCRRQTRRCKNRTKRSPRTQSFVFLVAKTLVSSDGLTSWEIAQHIMKKDPHQYSSADTFSSLVQRVRRALSAGKYFHKKIERRGCSIVWDVLPECKPAFLKNDVSLKSESSEMFPARPKKLTNQEKVTQKELPKSVAINNYAADVQYSITEDSTNNYNESVEADVSTTETDWNTDQVETLPLCTICKTSFSTNGELGKHVQVQHQGMSNAVESNITNNINNMLVGLLATFENAKAKPVNVCIVTGNQNVYMNTPSEPVVPNSTI